MDHSEAVRMQAVEKYILGELTPRLRKEFEAHYFDCVDCAVNLRAGVAFAAASRQYFAEAVVPEAVVVTPSSSWFGWWKPFVVVPAFAVLLFIVGYQNLVSIPNLRRGLIDTVAEAPPWFSLVDSTVHGSAGTRVEIVPGQPFDLVFDITASPRDANSVFVATAKDAAGNTVASLLVSARRAEKPVILHVPGGVGEGNYKVVILDQARGASVPAGELPFTVAFSAKIQQH